MTNQDPAQRVADELAIRNLVARLAQLADDGELSDYIELFTEDAVWDGGPALGVVQGHPEILAAARQRRADGRSGPGTHSRHVVTTQVVELQGDRATSRAVFHYYTKTDAAPTLSIMGIYEDELVRTARGWRLARRLVLAGQG